MNNIISITDLTATKTALRAIADQSKEQLDTALKMACTEETKKAVKDFKARLNKQFAELEAERKAATSEYEKPLKAFKELYDEIIAVPFKDADNALKTKVNEVEDAQKAEKKAVILEYATELLQAYNLTWLNPERIMPNVTLSASEKSLKKAVKDEADRIKSEVDCINAISENAEIMAEYINCLDLAAAQTIVAMRKKAVEQAEKFTAEYTEQEKTIQQAVEKVEQLTPPIVEDIETYQMTFTVEGTIEQLKVLKAFMINNNIKILGGNENE